MAGAVPDQCDHLDRAVPLLYLILSNHIWRALAARDAGCSRPTKIVWGVGHPGTGDISRESALIETISRLILYPFCPQCLTQTRP